MGITEWYPDTCDCGVEQNPPWTWVGTIRKCKLHQHLDGQALMDGIRAHRLPFIDRPENIIPRAFLEEADNADISVRGWAFQRKRRDIENKIKKQDEASQARRDEKMRIRKLP